MPKNLQISDARYTRLVKAARANGYVVEAGPGYVVKAGPGSQLGEFIDFLVSQAEPITGKQYDEIWARFISRIAPQVSALAAALRHVPGKPGIVTEASASLGRFSVWADDIKRNAPP